MASQFYATLGGEFLVNTKTTGQQQIPRVAKLMSGGFVLVWNDVTVAAGGEITDIDVRAQRYDTEGNKVGGEIVVNTITANLQGQATVTGLASGGFVIGWTDNSGGTNDVRAQIFNSNGARVGSSITLHSDTSGSQLQPTISQLQGGGFVATWRTSANDQPDTTDLKGQIFGPNGNRIGGEFLVSASANLQQTDATVTTLSSGRFVVSWTEGTGAAAPFGPSPAVVKAQIFEGNGTKVGGELVVTPAAVDTQARPAITALASGGFVVAWQDESGLGGDTSEYGIRGQLFNASGAKIGGAFQVNSSAPGTQELTRVTSLASGGFVVSWSDEAGDGSGYGVKAQIFDANGAKRGEEFLLNTTVLNSQLFSTLTEVTPGRLVAAWDDASGAGGDANQGVKAQLFALHGATAVQGTDAADNLSGTGGNDVLLGLAGDDQIFGGVGNDLIEGGVGADRLDGWRGSDVLLGGDGDDTLIGGAGRDRIEGGAGSDTLVLEGTLRDYFVVSGSAGATLISASDADFVANVEQVRIGGATVTWEEFRTTAFDGLRYIAAYSDLIAQFGANADAGANHYRNAGAAEGRLLTAFDPLRYAASNPDVANAFGNNAQAISRHYILNGVNENRLLTKFDPFSYIAANPDLFAVFGADPLAATAHYVTSGLSENRNTGTFKPLFYAASNPDVANVYGVDRIALLEHYMTTGRLENRETASFDALQYGASNLDLAIRFGADADALAGHYATFGRFENRALASFDTLRYAAASTDLAIRYETDEAGLLTHYLRFGRAEGRPLDRFDEVGYLLTYPDLAGKTAEQALTHWVVDGVHERQGITAFGIEQTEHDLSLGIDIGDVLGVAGDRDWFGVTLQAGQDYRVGVDASGSGQGTLANAFVQIFDRFGNLIASDDNSGPGNDALVSFEAGASGLYYIVVSSATSGVGTYTVSVDPVIG